jgi:uncharacterized protein involved in exopolysaccharide biosynthesis
LPSLGRLASQLGGIASMAGISIDSEPGANKSMLAMELLKSWEFLDTFIVENSLEVPLFAATDWDRATNKLILDKKLYDDDERKWVRSFNPAKGETAEPSSWELFVELRDRISVSQDPNTGVISISVEYYSPILAKEWVELLVAAVNERIRVRDRERARKSIEYLRQQVEQTSLAEMRMVFYKLIEEQTKNLMLTEVTDEYVLSTLASAKEPEEHSKPKRALICIAGTFVGIFLALVFAFFRNAFKATLARKDAEADGV